MTHDSFECPLMAMRRNISRYTWHNDIISECCFTEGSINSGAHALMNVSSNSPYGAIHWGVLILCTKHQVYHLFIWVKRLSFPIDRYGRLEVGHFLWRSSKEWSSAFSTGKIQISTKHWRSTFDTVQWCRLELVKRPALISIYSTRVKTFVWQISARKAINRASWHSNPVHLGEATFSLIRLIRRDRERITRDNFESPTRLA
jgi:hypothetical protein